MEAGNGQIGQALTRSAGDGVIEIGKEKKTEKVKKNLGAYFKRTRQN